MGVLSLTDRLKAICHVFYNVGKDVFARKFKTGVSDTLFVILGHMPKMKILNAVEQAEFDSPPEFDSTNRKKHFDFPMGILQLAEQLRTSTNKTCFLIASGYFSATKKFYSPQQFRQVDISMSVENSVMAISKLCPLNTPSRPCFDTKK